MECDGGAIATDTSTGHAEDTIYYVTIVRDESIGTHGTLYAYVYTDSARTVLAAKLEIALNTNKKDS